MQGTGPHRQAANPTGKRPPRGGSGQGWTSERTPEATSALYLDYAVLSSPYLGHLPL